MCVVIRSRLHACFSYSLLRAGHSSSSLNTQEEQRMDGPAERGAILLWLEISCPFEVLFPFLFTPQLHTLQPNLNPGEFLHCRFASSAEPPTSAFASVHLGQQTDANRNWTKTHRRWGLLYIRRWSLPWRFPFLICFLLWDSSFYFSTHFSPAKVKPDMTPLGILQPVNKPINSQMKTWQWPWANRLIAVKRPKNFEHHRSPAHSSNWRLSILRIFLSKNSVRWTRTNLQRAN